VDQQDNEAGQKDHGGLVPPTPKVIDRAKQRRIRQVSFEQ
jgi:hypothetical protein